MITGQQIRAGMAILRWSQGELAKRSGVASRTIQRMASVDGIPNTNPMNLYHVDKAFRDGTEKFYIMLGPDEHSINIFRQDDKDSKEISLKPLHGD